MTGMLTHPVIYFYTAFGAFVHWVLIRYGGNVGNGIDAFVEELFASFRPMIVAKMLLFVVVGSLIAVVMVAPATSRQALAAGMAWTTLLGRLGKKQPQGG